MAGLTDVGLVQLRTFHICDILRYMDRTQVVLKDSYLFE